MTTFTTQIAPPVGSRAARIGQGVIAKYIQELNAAARRSTRAQIAERTAAGPAVYASSSAQADELPADVSTSLARDEAGLSKRSACWSRGGRSTRSTLTQRLTETR